MTRKTLLPLFAVSLFACAFAASGFAQDLKPSNGKIPRPVEDIKALSTRFYQDINVAKALLRPAELEKLRKQKPQLPLAQRLSAAGIASRRRVMEIAAALADAKRFDPEIDGLGRESGQAFERLSGGFELIKAGRESGEGYEVELALYSVSESQVRRELREGIIRDFEAGKIDRRGVLKAIDSERKMITGDRLDYWTRKGNSWTLTSSPVHEAD
jgi:hypothetical protein